jgi:hypothetical protein
VRLKDKSAFGSCFIEELENDEFYPLFLNNAELK